MIYYENTNDDVFHPLSFEKIFVNHWRPIVQSLDLHFLNNSGFLGGFLVISKYDDAVCFASELLKVKEYLASTFNIDEGVKEYMVERIDQVVPLIRKALNEWGKVKEICVC